jgi:methionyl-tRNA formyltransferase
LTTVFLGTSDFAAAVLERLAESQKHRPVLVVTRPDRPRGRGQLTGPPPVAERARELGLRLAQPANVNDESARNMITRVGRGDSSAGSDEGPSSEHDPPTVIVCAFGALIREPLLSEHTILNVHPSLLPRWRGAAPVERAIMAGDAETGISIMRLTAGLDSGPVSLSAAEPIRPDDTYGSLAARLQALGGELLVRALDEDPPFVEQPDDGVTYAEKIGPEDRLLDPSRPAVELERQVRALHPRIGARLKLPNGSYLGVHRAALVTETAESNQDQSGGDAPAATPGLRAFAGRLLLDCSPGTLELVLVQPPGGKAMDGGAYLRGHELPGRR